MHIMVIDDDPGVLVVTKVMLKRMGHSVVSYRNPGQALDGMLEDHVDLVISDVQMPELDGYGVAERIAERYATSPPMVLLMSGCFDMGPQQGVALPSVVNGLLPKPFDQDDLCSALSRLNLVEETC